MVETSEASMLGTPRGGRAPPGGYLDMNGRRAKILLCPTTHRIHPLAIPTCRARWRWGNNAE
jgi:hypothetical protein